MTSQSIAEQLKFDTLDDAICWMEDEINDPCIDNFRYTSTDNYDGMVTYEQQQESGCCGSYDTYVTIGGKEWMIGCNYGH